MLKYLSLMAVALLCESSAIKLHSKHKEGPPHLKWSSLAQQDEGLPTNADEVMRDIDGDSDGRATKEEFMSFLGVSKGDDVYTWLEPLFVAAAGEDGEVTKDEAWALFESVMAAASA